MSKLPGSRQQIKPSPVELLSKALVAVAVLLLVHDIVADPGRDLQLLRTRWVGVGGSISLLFGAVSLHLARQQWAAGLYPLLTYTRAQQKESKFALDVAPGEKLWCIEVRNMGGLAIVDHVRYDIEMDGRPDSRRQNVDYREMLEILETSTGTLDENDFVYVNWQGGFGILPSDVARLCELPMSVARQIKKLDAHVFYTSRFGGLYKHVLSVIPDRGLPAKPGPPEHR